MSSNLLEKTKDNVKDITGSVFTNIKAIKKKQFKPTHKLFDGTLLNNIFSKEKLESVDNIQFSDENFNPQIYTNKIFTKHEWKNIDEEWIEDLELARSKTTEQLQSIVFSNYERLIEMSQSISSFIESDMVEMSSLINDMKKSVKGVAECELTFSQELSALPSKKTKKREQFNELSKYIHNLEETIVLRKFRDGITLCKQIEFILNNEEELENREEIRSLRKRYWDKKVDFRQVLVKEMYLSSDKKLPDVVGMISKMDGIETARDMYLEIQSSKILEWSAPSCGGVSVYVNYSMERMVDHIIKTIQSFNELFAEHYHSSSLSEWIVGEMTKQLNHIKSHIFATEDTNKIILSLAIVLEGCKRLEQYGVCVLYQVQSLMIDDLERSLDLYYSKIGDRIARVIEEESWQPVSIETVQSSLKDVKLSVTSSVCSSTIELHNQVVQLLLSYSPIFDNYIYDSITSGIISVFEEYFQKLTDMSFIECYGDSQMLHILFNIRFTREVVIPSISRNFSLLFHRSVPELNLLERKLTRNDERFVKKFVDVRARSILFDKLKWHTMEYPGIVGCPQVELSKGIINILKFIVQLGTLVSNIVGDKDVKPILRNFMDGITLAMRDESCEFWNKFNRSITLEIDETDDTGDESKSSETRTDTTTEDKSNSNTHSETETTESSSSEASDYDSSDSSDSSHGKKKQSLSKRARNEPKNKVKDTKRPDKKESHKPLKERDRKEVEKLQQERAENVEEDETRQEDSNEEYGVYSMNQVLQVSYDVSALLELSKKMDLTSKVTQENLLVVLTRIDSRLEQLHSSNPSLFEEYQSKKLSFSLTKRRSSPSISNSKSIQTILSGWYFLTEQN